MKHPGQWQYVATRLMAHMGAYIPSDLNRLHWRWHHRAALRIREALIRHNVRRIRTQCQRSLTAQVPPRQVARTGNSQSPHR